MKRWGARLADVTKHQLHKVFLLCVSNLSVLHPFDNMVMIHWVKNRSKTGRLAVSSWGINPWSIICGSHWKFICRNKGHQGTSKISTLSEIALRAHFHARYGIKTAPVFLPADGEASWSYFQVWSHYYQAADCNQKTPIPLSSRWQVRSEKDKKDKHEH